MKSRPIIWVFAGLAAILIALILVKPTKEAWRIRMAEKIAAAQLIDPSSAQFSDVYIPKTNPTVVCGQINGKNRYGGYAGKQPFYAPPGNYAHIGEDIDYILNCMRK